MRTCGHSVHRNVHVAEVLRTSATRAVENHERNFEDDAPWYRVSIVSVSGGIKKTRFRIDNQSYCTGAHPLRCKYASSLEKQVTKRTVVFRYLQANDRQSISESTCDTFHRNVVKSIKVNLLKDNCTLDHWKEDFSQTVTVLSYSLSPLGTWNQWW